MKKVIMFSIAAYILLLFAPVQVSAATDYDPIRDTLTMQTEVGLMNARLEEIKNMDMSMLARSEKRALRKEVRGIEQDLKAYDGGVYISVGAAILIVLLLILLL